MGRYEGWNFFGPAQPATSELAAANQTWGEAGVAYETIDTTLETADLVRVEIPANCTIESIEVHMNTIAGGATQVTMVAFRDANGDSMFLSDMPAGATQRIRVGLTTATQGGAAWLVNKDHHPAVFSQANIATLTADASNPGGNQTAALWLGFYLDAGTARVDRVLVNWRA